MTSEAARELGKRGGRARVAKARAARPRLLRLGGLLPELNVDKYFAPFREEGERWFKAKVEELARDVGGGQVGAGVLAILEGAAWDRAQARFLREVSAAQGFAWVIGKEGEKPGALPRLDLIAAASKLDAEFTRKLAYAHELAAKEAQARPKANAYPWAALPPSTTPTSASAGPDQKADLVESTNDDDAIDVEPAHAHQSHDDAPSVSHDEDAAEHEGTSPTPVVMPPPPQPSGPKWLPPCLWPHAPLFEHLASMHPMARHGSIAGTAEVLARAGRLGNRTIQGDADERKGAELMNAVRQWFVAHPIPHEMT